MKSSLSLEDEIEDLFNKKKYNCCKTVMIILSKKLNIALSQDLLKISSVYGGGIGKSGCVCGALIGALNIAALKYGDNASKASDMAAKMYNEFMKTHGTRCCRKLRDNFTKPREICKDIVKNTIMFSLELIKD